MKELLGEHIHKNECVPGYFAKMGCKSRVDSRIFSGSKCGILCLVGVAVGNRPLHPGLFITFTAKRKMAVAISPWRSHLFSSLILTLL